MFKKIFLAVLLLLVPTLVRAQAAGDCAYYNSTTTTTRTANCTMDSSGDETPLGNFTATAGQNTVTVYNLNGQQLLDGYKYAASATGINAALSAIQTAGGGILVLPNQSITITADIVCPVNTPFIVEGSGPVSALVQNFSSSPYAMFYCKGTETSTTTTLSSAPVIGSNALSVASSSSFSAGEWVEIYDTALSCGYNGGGGATYCDWEMEQVDSVSTGVITLRSSIYRSIANGGKVAVVNPVFATFKDFLVDSTTDAPTTAYSILCQWCVDLNVHDMQFNLPGSAAVGAGLLITHSVYGRIHGNSFSGGVGTYAAGQNYGVPYNILGASSYFTVSNNSIRKIVETGVSEGASFVTQDGNNVHGFSDSAMGIHGQSTYQYFGNIFSNNILDGGTICIAVSYNSGTTVLIQDTVISGNTCTNYGTVGGGATGIDVAGAANTGCTVTTCTYNIKNVTITGNAIRNPVYTGTLSTTQSAIQVQYVQGIAITGNNIQDIPANGQGIQGEGLNSFTVANNVVHQTRTVTGDVGIYLQDGGVGAKITTGSVTGNVVTGFGAQGIRLDSSAAGYSSNVTYTGNTALSNATNYLISSSATSILRYNNIGDTNTNANGKITLVAGVGSFTFPQAYANAPTCTATDTTAANAVKISATTTAIAVTGTTTDVISYHCDPVIN